MWSSVAVTLHAKFIISGLMADMCIIRRANSRQCVVCVSPPTTTAAAAAAAVSVHASSIIERGIMHHKSPGFVVHLGHVGSGRHSNLDTYTETVAETLC